MYYILRGAMDRPQAFDHWRILNLELVASRQRRLCGSLEQVDPETTAVMGASPR